MRVVPASGIIFWLMDRLGIDALTTPWQTIYLRHDADCWMDASLIAHEMVHIDQIRRLGACRFSTVYLYQIVRYGYWSMPLEIEARQRSGQDAPIAGSAAVPR